MNVYRLAADSVRTTQRICLVVSYLESTLLILKRADIVLLAS